MNTKLQEAFIQYLVKGREQVTVFLTNGVKLSGILTHCDDVSVILTRDGFSQLILKHAIATIMPFDGFNIFDVMGE